MQGNFRYSFDADGNTLTMVSPTYLTGQLSVYSNAELDTWALEQSTETCIYNSTITGDTVLAYSCESESIIPYSISGDQIGESIPTTMYTSSYFTRTMDAAEQFLAVAQPDGGSSDYSSGRVLIRRMDQIDYPVVDTIAAPGTSYFGSSIRFNGNVLLVIEGGFQNPYPSRVFVYQRSSDVSESWSFATQIEMTDTVLSWGDLPTLDLSSEGLAILSTPHSYNGFGLYTRVVSIWDFSSTESTSIHNQNPESLNIRRVGSTLHLCDPSGRHYERTVASILDLSGRIVQSISLQDLCGNGVELSNLLGGIYLVQLETSTSRSVLKLAW